MTNVTFATLGVAEPLLRALEAEGYTTPTPIQTQAIPRLLEGSDLLGIAQTGTGKTAAFALPILQRLAADKIHAGPRGTRALVLAPTRELAIQIATSFKTYGRHLSLRYATVYGGVSQRAQVDALSRGVDVLIATPGRLLDLMTQRHVRLDKVNTLVLDEADRMLDMGFIRDVTKIVAAMPKERQSLLFSATMPQTITKLAHDILKNPLRIEVTPAATTVERIDQRVFFVPTDSKRGLLATLLNDAGMSRVMVFTRTKHGANRVVKQLEAARVTADAIHGNKSQNARQKALNAFRDGSVRVLVATDIAARGIDVDGITHVVNYELPNEPESYVHRIGRTARAGTQGIAIAFCDPTERSYLRAIERITKRPLTVLETPTIAPGQTQVRGHGHRNEREEEAPRSQTPRRDHREHRAGQNGHGKSGHSQNPREQQAHDPLARDGQPQANQGQHRQNEHRQSERPAEGQQQRPRRRRRRPGQQRQAA